MVMKDFECRRCRQVHEALVESNRIGRKCPFCAGNAKRIISLGRVNTANESPDWMKSVLEVVDRENKASHVQEFVRNPTRENYKNWMKGENIRPMDYTERGGPPVYRKPEIDTSRIHKEVLERYRQRNRTEVRG